MRLLTLLIALILCASVLLIGCERIIKQSVVGNAVPPQISLEKAQAAMKGVSGRRAAVQQKVEETGDFSTIFTASDDIFREELGFRKELWVDLVEIYRQENLENAAALDGLENLQGAFAEKLKAGTLEMFYFQYISAFDEIIIEYLRLSFEFPEKNEQELLALFRVSMRDQKAIIVFP